MDQDRVIQDFFDNLNRKFSDATKRLTNLESYEYTSTNFYGSMGIKSTETYTTTLPNSSAVRVRGMYANKNKGFTLDDSSLVCERDGIYLCHYFLGATLPSALTLSALVVGDITTYVYSKASGTTGTLVWLGKTAPLSLAEGEAVYLSISSSVYPVNIIVNNASVVLHRIADN